MIKLPRAFQLNFTALAALAAGGLLPSAASAQEAGSIDRSFTPYAAAVANSLDKSPASVRALAVQSDGAAIVAGTYNGDAGGPMLLRLRADGKVDRSFRAEAPDAAVQAISLTPEGKAVIGGSFSRFSGQSAVGHVARLNANGSLDASFRTGTGADGAVRAIAAQKDGRLLIGGAFASFNGSPRDRLARLNADGSLDSSFDPGVVSEAAVDAVAVQEGDGSVLVAGSFSVNGAAHTRIVRLQASGRLDSTFNAAGVVNGRVRSIAAQPDGKIVLGGDFDVANQHGIARLNADGSLDSTFEVGAGVDGAVYAVAVHGKDNRIVLAGSFGSVNGVTRLGVARLNANGSIDRAFSAGDGANAKVRAIAFGAGKLVIGGDFTLVDGVVRGAVARLHLNAAAVATRMVSRGPVTKAVGTTFISFGASSYTASENTGFAMISVVRTGDTSTPSTVTFSTANGGTATAGADYTPTTATVSWAAGDALVKFVNVPLAVDGLAEPDETVVLNLTAPTGASLAGNATAVSTTLTITDEQPTFLQFTTTAYSVSETAGRANITVTRSGGSSRAVSVYYQTQDDTTGASPATSGADYTPTFGQLAWATGDFSPKTFTVPIVIDAVSPEANETVLIQILGSNGPAALGPRVQATLTIADIAASTLQFSAPTFTVRESTGLGVVTVTRSGGDGSPVSVDYQTFDSDAVGTPDPNFKNSATLDPNGANADYLIASGTLNWAQGDYANKSIAIQINTNDSTPEPDQSLVVALGNAQGASVTGPQNQATLTITETQPTVVNFSASSYVASEKQGSVVITATRTGGGFGAASVDFTTTDGTAVGGSDYTPVSGTLFWPPGDFSPKTFTVPIISDNVQEPDEVLVLNLLNPLGLATLGSQGQATLTITDAPPASIQFSTSTIRVNETAGTAMLTVTRTANFSGAATVNYATVDGTATAGVDYTYSVGTLTFADGDMSPQTITIPIVSDNLVEGNETFTVVLTTPVGQVVVGTPASVQVTIVDSPITNLQFTAANYNASEKAVNGSVITVTRTGDISTAVSVDYSTADGTATAGQDYTATSGTLTWDAGDRQPKTFVVPITLDNLVEPAETVLLTLSNAVGPVVLGLSSSTITIIDAPTTTLDFSQANFSVSENSPAGATITVTRTGDLTTRVSVDYSTLDITATAGQDYTPVTGTLTWEVGDSQPKGFVVPILADNLTEPTEMVQLNLSNPVGPVVLGPNSGATLTIVDNAVSTLEFSSSAYSGNEATPFGSITVAVTRTGNSAGAVSVSYQLVAGTATAGADYIDNFGTLTWADGDLSPKTFVVTIRDDTTPEVVETLKAMLSNPVGAAVLGANSEATLSIKDNDPAPILQFSAATYSVNESSTSAVITVTRTGSNLGEVKVDYLSVAGGTATAGSDYTPTVGTLTFAAGDVSPKSFLVPIINDSVMEGPETVLLSLSNPTGFAQIGAQAQTTLTIVDDDMPSAVQFTAASYNAAAGATSVVVTVSRIGGSGSAVSVNYNTADGTAVAGLDYAATSGTLNWGIGDITAKSFVVPILNSAAGATPKAFSVVLSNPVGTSLGTANQAAITILGTTTPVVSVIIKQTDIAEGVGKGKFVFTRVGGDLSQDLKVNLLLKGSAVKGVDYVGGTRKVTIPAGQTSVRLKVKAVNDGLVEGTEKIKLIVLPGDGYTVGSPAVATLRIDDAN